MMHSLFTGLRSKSTKADNLNNQTFYDYYSRIRLLALSLFEWTGFPDSISVRFLEQSLFEMGKAAFILDKTKGYLALKCTPSGELNVYLDPIKLTAYSTNYNQEFILDEGCVLIRNNYDMLPTEPTIRLFAQRLTNVERTLDTNIHAQKTPILILCDDKQRLTLKNLYHQYDGNEPFIFGDKSMNPDMVKSIKTEAPFLADRLMVYKRDIWNECMTFLGINNANTDKRERLITDEVEANDQLIQMSAQTMLLSRLEACKQINKLFGLSVTVKIRDTAQLADKDPDQDPEEEDQGEGEQDNG